MDIVDASLIPAMTIAVIAGFLSFLSPCVLPIVPPYLAYMGGITVGTMAEDRAARRRAFLSAISFVLGLSTVFLFLGFTASAMGRVFLQNQQLFVVISGLMIMAFGAHFLGIFRIGLLDREFRLDAGVKGGSTFGAYVLGLAFAFGWTPCIGPQLGAILTLAATEASLARGTTLLGIYALGLGIPFLLVAVFFPRLTWFMDWMKRHMYRIERVTGLLLWTVGIMMLTGQFSAFSLWLLENIPVLARLG